MKTSMERMFPIAMDIQEQHDKDPGRDYVFFYDDGSIYRAFLADGVEIGGGMVKAYVKQPLSDLNLTLVAVPDDTAWRLVHKSLLEFTSGAMLEQIELIGAKQKQDLKEKMFKKLGWDEEGKTKKKKDKEPDVSGIKLSTGQFI